MPAAEPGHYSPFRCSGRIALHSTGHAGGLRFSPFHLEREKSKKHPENPACPVECGAYSSGVNPVEEKQT